MPIKKIHVHRVREARMVFIDGVEGEDTVTHMSNRLPDMKVGLANDQLEETLLTIGKIATLNVVQTKQGWVYASALIILGLGALLVGLVRKTLHNWRYLRALD